MTRLYRPHIPLTVRCLVALRQLGEEYDLANWRNGYGVLLEGLLVRLAAQIGCDLSDLRLDHDPPLGARQFEERHYKFYYQPDANDPEYLFYRPHGTQFDGSHDVKTRIRGDHGQYSDITLIKRKRRREKPPTAHQVKMADLRAKQRKLQKLRKEKEKSQWPKRPMRSSAEWIKK